MLWVLCLTMPVSSQEGFGCDPATCPFCCIEYEPGVKVCADDILHCKLKKRGKFSDVVTLLIVMASVIIAFPVMMNLARFLLFHPISRSKSTIGLIMYGSSKVYDLILGKKDASKHKMKVEETSKDDVKRRHKKRFDNGLQQDSDLDLIDKDEDKSNNNSQFFDQLSDDLSEDNEVNNILQIPLDDN